MNGQLPIILILFLCALMLSFLQWLHGVGIFGYGVLIFGVGVLVSIGYWLFDLCHVKVNDTGLRKRNVAIKLSLFLLFAFSMTFIMMFMYHWLNEDGHVHGASGGGGHVAASDTGIGQHGHAVVFSNVHLRGYLLPVSVTVGHKQLKVSAKVPSSVVLTFVNRSDMPVYLRVSAKSSPSQVKHFVNYSLLYDDKILQLAPKETKELVTEIAIGHDFPIELEPFSLDHFVFGLDHPSAWKKMQGSIQLISDS
ncbi:MAG: hypothetical protein VX737_03340 [Pseudomonadota bacterium]|nr:hypothetical protein [Pseudomonadota bacterium]